jgi:carboxyl-terminal processing protease
MTVAVIERRKALTLTVVLVFVCSAISFFAGSAGLVPRLAQFISYNGAGTGTASGQVDQKRLQQIQQYIQDKYLYPVSVDKMTDGALKGMVEATGDQYSAYYTPPEFQSFLDHFKSSFSGIGVHVELSPKTGLVTVVSPIKGSPGDQAGIKTGDGIVQVDDKDVRGMKLDEAVQLIRGPKGSKVKLKVQREGVDEPLTFTIVRAQIEVESTEHRMLDQSAGIGYIQVREFNEQVSQRIQRGIGELKGQGMTRLIVDLRQNPGGLLDEAVNVSSLFVPAKKPVVFIEHKGGQKETLESKGLGAWNGPLVLLVDEGSASASEIFSGAIKDLKLGTLVGTKTFGKGLVQTFYDLPDGAGIKLTTASYLTAGGNAIHGKGILPDIEIVNTDKVLPGDPGDVQLQKAISVVKTLK